MEPVYKQRFKARWGDMDYNAHMSNTAYLDVAGDVRMLFFEENGFSMREFEKLHLGPVIMKDEISYYKELRLLEEFEVHQLLSGISEDGSRFRLCNIFINADGKKAAMVTSSGGWLDLQRRVLVPPPANLLAVIHRLVKTDDFEVLPNSTK